VQPTVEDLFESWCRDRDGRALAAVFDRVAAELWRVAFHLSGNRSEADDLLQTTFLAAMQSAARWRREQPLVPWLLGILVNKLRMQRRRQRQALPARGEPEEENDPVAAAERSELRALLQECVERLDEPYRAVLVLQLEHGLTAAEIAVALGRPRATVRSQLHRGLELLRRGLPLGLFGTTARAISVPALGPVRAAVLAAAGGGVATGTLLSAGAVLMAKKLLVAGVALLATIAGVWWAWPPPEAEQVLQANRGASSSIAANVAPGARDEVPVVGEQRVDAAVAAPVGPTTGGLRVQVRWSDGTPATGMGVSLEPPHRDGGFLAQRWRDTDAAGVVEWRDLPPNTFTVAARHGGEQQFTVLAGAVAQCEITIPAGDDLRGLVVDPDGKPVPGATIVLGLANIGSTSDRLLEATRADGNGAFFLRSVPAKYHVAACAAGFTGSTAQSAAALVNMPPVQLQLGPAGGAVEGRVVDELGMPIEGAWVAEGQLGFSRAPQRALQVVRSDAGGRFRLLGLPFGWTSYLHAAALGRISWSGEVRLGVGSTPFVDIQLPRGATLRGIARTRAGEPVPKPSIPRVQDANAPAKGMADQRPRWCLPRVVTDESGAFLVEQIAAGKVGLSIEDRTGELVAYGEFVARPGEEIIWDAVLEPRPMIRGNVVDADGRPLVGWRVMADGPEGVPAPVSTPTAQDGSFAAGPCLPTTYTLLVYGADQNWISPVHHVPGVVPGAEPIVIRVPRACVASCFVSGTFVADVAEGPITVTVFDLVTGNRITAETRAGQPFDLGPVPAGRYAVQVEVPIGERGTMVAVIAQQDLVPGHRWDLGTVSLPAPGEVAVELLGLDGKPVRKAQLSLALCDGLMAASVVAIVDGRGSTKAMPGAYHLAANLQDLPFEHPLIHVRSGERSVVRLQAGKTVRRLIVFDLAITEPVTLTMVTLRKVGVTMWRGRSWFGTDVPSHAWNRDFTPGNWELELELPNGRTERFPFVVTADTDAPPIEIRVAK